MFDSEKVRVEACMKRMEAGDANAFHTMGILHLFGELGMQKDTDKALEMFLRAAELGAADSHSNIANMYHPGTEGVVDHAKYLYHCQQAAMKGCPVSRSNLGCYEANAGNTDRAMKHWMISAGMGHGKSLENIKRIFISGNATKAQYEKALRDYQAYMDEVKSDQRDEAAAKRRNHVIYRC